MPEHAMFEKIEDSQKPLILASHSPRRRELLKQLGVKFDVVVKDLTEHPIPGLSSPETVKALALQKAKCIAASLSGGIVLGADTMVEYEGRFFNKPRFAVEAEKFLAILSGKTHNVHTGVALIDVEENRYITACDTTEVTFRTLTPAEIKVYVRTKEPMDKAGAYAIQGKGSVFVEKIEGSYSNVVGLPLELLARILPNFGIRVLNRNRWVMVNNQ